MSISPILHLNSLFFVLSLQMIEKLEQFDRDLFLYLNGLHADWLDPFMWWISSTVSWIPLMLFVFYYAYKKGQLRLLFTLIIGIAICILLADRISVELFKEVFQRYRPTHNSEIGDLVHTVIKPNGEEYRGGQFSFVSSHATNSAAMGAFIYLHFKKYNKYWAFLFLWIAFVQYSRIYLGVHYPADLVGGSILGIVIAVFVYWISKKFMKQVPPE